MMSGVRSKDTKPEVAVRKGLHAKGFRYRLHDPALPGKPDIVFPKYRAVVFVNGCFWHGHDCHLFKLPSTRPDFWKAKIARNTENDKNARNRLQELGWRVMTVWECALKGREKIPLDALLAEVADWLANGVSPDEARSEIRGDR